ncbi:GH25 family lysozyme [Defluviimonas sp. D31]|uniref:glycoside hydrolase family 25 protein n=1 Tax=Defluviimonas sp. D31 TaxID=3083253 RepID=UPI00296ED994|nr:GH25 family lysozyme [Defluviimonas sp. D31]MDW4549451.1 GH25 family lysozyme [Defluviimonas sp. D31]
MRPIGRFLAALTLIAMSGCGGGNDRVAGIPQRFSDIDPYDWRGITPAHHPVHGVDVSRYQGAVDWHRVRGSGVSFAFIKATEGGDYADPMFYQHWSGAAQAGIPRGAYHFYYLCRSAVEQAQWFIANVPAERGTLPPVLDMEWNHTSKTCRSRPDPAVIRSEIETFQRIVGARFGQRPVIYTAVDFWSDNELWKLRGEEFWLRSVAGHPSIKYPGQDWSFWQYTGTGVVPGISGEADLNAFAGSEAAWSAWLARRSL